MSEYGGSPISHPMLRSPVQQASGWLGMVVRLLPWGSVHQSYHNDKRSETVGVTILIAIIGYLRTRQCLGAWPTAKAFRLNFIQLSTASLTSLGEVQLGRCAVKSNRLCSNCSNFTLCARPIGQRAEEVGLSRHLQTFFRFGCSSCLLFAQNKPAQKVEDGF